MDYNNLKIGVSEKVFIRVVCETWEGARSTH